MFKRMFPADGVGSSLYVAWGCSPGRSIGTLQTAHTSPLTARVRAQVSHAFEGKLQAEKNRSPRDAVFLRPGSAA